MNQPHFRKNWEIFGLGAIIVQKYMDHCMLRKYRAFIIIRDVIKLGSQIAPNDWVMKLSSHRSIHLI
jgi:hypothetical protein